MRYLPALIVPVFWLNHIGLSNGQTVTHRASSGGAALTRSQPLSSDELRTMAKEKLRIGLTGGQVAEILKANGLTRIMSDYSPRHVTAYYGSGNLKDPILKIEMRIGDKNEWLLQRWNVEE
jgi:hypothetical protein